MRRDGAINGMEFARVSNGSATSGIPSTAPSEWRNLPQPPTRDPETAGKGDKEKESERNLPTAPPDRPPDEAA